MSELNQKIKLISEELKVISKKEIYLMEVCGTHTMSIARHGIRSMLPENINIISGPGCPVCVTAAGDIKAAIDLAKRDDFIIATFGDMLKVPAEGDTLQNYKNVKVLYNPLDSLQLATDNPNKNIVFLGIGFETTTPLIASVIKIADRAKLKNFSVLSMHKLVPPALQVIASAPDNKIKGLILPGHVSAITGRKYFDFIKEAGISGVVTGFEALEMMESIYLLTKFLNQDRVEVYNNYKKVVTEDGNKLAMDTMFEIFQVGDVSWRGIGVIPKSGLEIKDKFSQFDAKKRFDFEIVDIADPKGCRCGEILMGKAKPIDCGLYGKRCTPSDPVGPCMVSSEGTCAAYFKYLS